MFVDDLREPPEGWTVARTSADAVAILNLWRLLEIHADHLSLDHDLGGDDTTRPVMLWMCENDWWPARLTVHTANPVGREFLEGTALRYGPEGMLE
ncbi:cyclic-phosphate processing receiver domain-containing protein [Nocardia jiangxiensis]|uniref:cyclic-phosphate processing receiver domain-containing protein n=1 Tax=Nocardia jiangxiensis TaxID=282685 RepID=UPI001FE114D8|nr:cyclic-phosphate processing receiver domain-containing protein [Nocardia jiangxiensis]